MSTTTNKRVEPILMETISLWRNSTKFKYLFFHLEIYLIKQIDMEMFINDFEYVVDA